MAGPHNFQARQGKSAVDNYTILWLPRSYLLGISQKNSDSLYRTGLL